MPTTFRMIGNTVNAGNNVIINTGTSSDQTSTMDLKKLHKNLQPVDNAAYDSYVSTADRCFEGTRVQVLKDIWAWIYGQGSPASVYILDGVAGIGKSTVAQTIAHQAATVGILGASYFFTRDEEERMTTRRFIPTIAYQLAVNQKKYASLILTALNSQPDVTRKNLDQQLDVLIINPLREVFTPSPRSISRLQRLRAVLSLRKYFSQKSLRRELLEPEKKTPIPIIEAGQSESAPILVVIDALDECNVQEAGNLLRLLINKLHTIPTLKVLVTTRPELNVRQVLERDKEHERHERFKLHEIEDSIVQSDIQLYIKSHLTLRRIKESLPGLGQPWQPTAQEMRALCGICGTLFIIASTVLKFVLDPRRSNPKGQLLRLLDGVTDDFSGSQRTDAMDKIYMHVLLSARPDDDEPDDQDWMSLYQNVLGALITLQYPLPRRVLASLLNIDESEIECTLVDLHALVAPKGPDQIFRIHHKTFPDFITDQHRISKASKGLSYGLHQEATMFRIDTKAHQAKLAKHCFRVMKAKLKRNIRDLSSYDAYKDHADVQHLLPSGISDPELAYACTQWAFHLEAGSKGSELDDDLKGYLEAWQSHHLLAWLEVLATLGKIDTADFILRTAAESIVTLSGSWPESKRIAELLHDACKLVERNRDIIKLSPTHIHWSLPPFIPTNTLLYNSYKHAGNGLKLVSGAETGWGHTVAILRHEGGVRSVAFTSDGSRLASASDKTVRLWDGSTGSQIATLEGHTDWVNAVAFSSDESRLASASDDKTVQIWDWSLGVHIATLRGHLDAVRSVAFSSDKSRLASASDDNTVRLWDERTGTHIATLEGHLDSVRCVAFSGDRSILASASDDNTVRLWDGRTGAHIVTLEGHSNGVNAVAFSSDGSRLASASKDKTVRLWDGSTGAHLATIKGHSRTVNAVTFSSDGSRLASASEDKTVRLWNGSTGAHLAILEGHTDWVNAVTFSSDGSRLTSASDDKTVRVWDGRTGTNIGTLECHWYSVTSVAFSSDGSRLASASGDNTVRLWGGSTGAHIATLEGHTDWVNAVAFSSDGLRLASASFDMTVQLWDGSTGAHIATLKDYWYPVTSVAFSSDGLRLASASRDNTVRLRDGSTGTYIAILKGHSDSVTSVTFSRSRLASASFDKTVRLWDGRTGAHITTLNGHTRAVRSVAFSGDGSSLASASKDLTVRLWDGKTGAPLYVFTHGSINDIHGIAFAAKQLPMAQTAAKLLFVLVERVQPKLFGLVALAEGPEGQWHDVPFLWFPAYLDPISIAVNANGSIALGCRNGRVLLLDISNVVFP